MQYRFAELVDLSGFQQVMQSWYSVAGVATALLDPDRNVLCAVGWQDICTRFHHLPEEAEGRCPYSDDNLFGNLREGEYVVHQCEHGLMNCAMPVLVRANTSPPCSWANSCMRLLTKLIPAGRRRRCGLTLRHTWQHSGKCPSSPKIVCGWF